MYKSIKGGMKTVGYVMLPLALATGCATGLESRVKDPSIKVEEPNGVGRAKPMNGIWEVIYNNPLRLKIEQDAEGFFVGTRLGSQTPQIRGKFKDDRLYCETRVLQGGWVAGNAIMYPSGDVFMCPTGLNQHYYRRVNDAPETRRYAEELFPYKGPTITYDGKTLPDLNGKNFFLEPGSRVRTSEAEFKVELIADGIKIITTSGTSFHAKGDSILEANISYNPKTNRYDLNGKFLHPGENSKALKYCSIWTDNSGKNVIGIGFGSGNEEVYFRIREK